MITLKLVLDRRRAKKNGSYPLLFRITSNRESRDVPTGHSILENDWDETSGKLKKSLSTYSVVAPKLQELELKYLGKIVEYERKNNGATNIQELKEFISSSRKGKIHVKDFWLLEIESLKKNNRHGGARVYQQAFDVLNKTKSLDVPFEKVDFSYLKGIETLLITKGYTLQKLIIRGLCHW